MDRYSEFLNQRKQAGNLRRLTPLMRLGRGRVKEADAVSASYCIDFSSNDYLALAEHPQVVAAAREALLKDGAGSGAARLMSGSLAGHQLLETETARLKGTEAALLFGSGYLANIGVIQALVGRGDAIFCDRLNHASIYDGCRLAGAKTYRFQHNDSNHLETLLKKHRGAFRQALIVVESIYSMDGDRCPLKELAALRNRFDCLLMVDEAHATGVFGPQGAGIIAEDGVIDEVDIAMGTFGKALGSYGAYVAASQQLVQYLINQARSFIYSTALPPPVIGASLAALCLIKTEPELRKELHAKVEMFKQFLYRGGISQDLGPSQIVPLMIGDSEKAVALAAKLKEKHIFATPVRPPTVPENTARIRFSITRHHQQDDLKNTAETLLTVMER
jgi:glycine C-acetyltransferase/8-amino-7-oxononanoate synthase